MAGKGLGLMADLLLQQVIGKSGAEIGREVGRELRGRLWQSGAVVVAVGLAVAGLIAAIFAVYLCLLDRFTPLGAMIWLAVGLLLLAAIFALIAWRMPRWRSPGNQPARRQAPVEPELAGLLMEEIGGLIGDHPAKATLAALAAGLILGYCPEARAGLVELLKSLKGKPSGNE